MTDELTIGNTADATPELRQPKVKKTPAGAQARYAAIKRLIKAHKDEFDMLYTQEAEKLGVKTRASTKAARIAAMEAKLKELKGA